MAYESCGGYRRGVVFVELAELSSRSGGCQKVRQDQMGGIAGDRGVGTVSSWRGLRRSNFDIGGLEMIDIPVCAPIEHIGGEAGFLDEVDDGSAFDPEGKRCLKQIF